MRWLIGAILIIIGVIYLGQNLDWWSGAEFQNIGRFWPLILVLIGVSVLTKHLKWGWLVFMAVLLASIGLVFYASVYDKNLLQAQSEKYSDEISYDLTSGAKSVEVRIDTGALELRVRENESAKFIEGDYTFNLYKPLFENYYENEKQVFKLSGTEKWNSWRLGDTSNKADFKLNQDIPMSLIINAGASKLNLNLEKINCTGVDISAGASEINLTIGEKIASEAKINIKAGASSIKIFLPKELGAKLTVDAPLSGKELRDLDKVGDNEFKTKNYDVAAKKIEISIDAGVSSIEVKQ